MCIRDRFDDLDQIHLPDPVMQDIENLKQENARLKKRLAHLRTASMKAAARMMITKV